MNKIIIDIDREWLETIFETNDHYGKMMRMSVEIEESLIKLIQETQMEYKSKRPLKEITLGQILRVLEKNKLPAQIVCSLKKFNQIRRAFAHSKWKNFNDYSDIIDQIISDPGVSNGQSDFKSYKFRYKKREEVTIGELDPGDQLAAYCSLISAHMLAFSRYPKEFMRLIASNTP